MMAKLVFSLVLVMVFSCRDNPGSGPGKIYYGEDVCEQCKMIISEKDFAAQYQLINGNKTVKFDDLGCMFRYLHDHKKSDTANIYVMDYASKNWIDAKSAYYVRSADISTPMGYGILAFKERQEATKEIERENGIFIGNLNNATNWILNHNNMKEGEDN